MAKFKTLDMHLVNLRVIRNSAGDYTNTVTATDWDDGVTISFQARMEFPIIALSTFKVRIQVEDLIESPPPPT